METFARMIDSINGFVWGYFLMFLIVGTGIFLTIRMRFVQVRFFGHAISLVSGKWDKHGNDDCEHPIHSSCPTYSTSENPIRKQSRNSDKQKRNKLLARIVRLF